MYFIKLNLFLIGLQYFQTVNATYPLIPTFGPMFTVNFQYKL